ncbi:hypothetical protein DLAC_10885 [Tieghemostelium lacteum]|uniref:BRCT domain-containing protein n=1 Tax=Tieghemostelium lacteum TaxID=361077 RepID=A0A151Z2M6_TIELA|nr:hypothetical protein DLAC_10885 [Tieghemostelium lacteum]|eukprot:KYQ88199.1 hypothetical protein DLAC_10885 [Tieghemostelium lacteum]
MNNTNNIKKYGRNSKSTAATTTTPQNEVEEQNLEVISNLFSGINFLLLGFNLKENSKLKQLIKSYGGDVCLVLNKNIHYLITTKEEFEKNSSKIQQALKLENLEIVDHDFVTTLCFKKRSLDLTIIDDHRLYKRSPKHSSSSTSSSATSIQESLFKLDLKSDSTTKTLKKKSQSLNALENISKAKRTLKLFVSSTFLDMTKEREYISNYLIPQLKEYCNNRMIELTHVDMRWGITNEEMKRKNTIATCLNEVQNSNYFISLLGQRYGWSQGAEYDESYQLATTYFPWLSQDGTMKNRSITELEIIQALKNSNRNCFFYHKQLPKDGSTKLSQEMTGEDQSPESIDKLVSLKKSLLDKNLQNYFEINELISLIYKDIIKRIEKEYPLESDSDQSQYQIDKHLSYSQSMLKYYISNNPIVHTRLNQYVVSSQLRSSVSSDNQVVILTGPSGYGKSTLISNWLLKVSQSKTTLDPKKSLVVLHHIGITSTNRWDILKQLYQIIKSHYQVNVPISDDQPQSLLEEMNYWFDVATRDGKKLVWILDGIEHIEKSSNESISESMLWLPTKFTSNIKLIYSISSDQSDKLEVLQKLYPNHTTLNLKGFDTPELVVEFSREYLKFYSKELDPVQLEILKKVHKPCESPLFLSTVLGQLVSIGNFENLNEKLIQLLLTQMVLALYITIINRWEQDENYPKGMCSQILSLIYLSEVGLYENEILDILALKSSYGFFSAIRMLFSSSSNFFSVHQSPWLKLAIKFKYFPQDQDDQNPTSIKLKSDMASYFYSSLKKSNNASTKRYIDYIPRLLVNIGDKSMLKEYLLDFSVLSHLISTDSQRRSLVNYWKSLGYQNKELISFYQVNYSESYKRSNPPMEEFSQVTLYLAKLFEYLSFYDLAFEFLDTSKDYHVQLYGELHPKVLMDIEQLSYLSIKRSKFETAEYLAEKSLSIAETLYGKEQIGTCESHKLNGFIQKKLTNYKSAKEFYENAILILCRYLGYTSSPIIESNNQLENNNNNEKSSKLFNSKLADLYYHLGDIYRKLSNHELALDYYNRTIEVYSNLRDHQHPSFAPLYRNLGLVEKKLGKYQDAVKYYQLALNIIKTNVGEDHAEFGLCQCDLADTYRKQDNYKEAESLYQKSLIILKSKLGENDIEVAEVYNDLGLIRKKLSQYNEAIEFYKKAIVIAEDTLGGKHQKVSFYNHNLADCYRKLGDYKKAEQLFLKCLLITQEHLGSDHPEVAEILNSLGLVYKKQSKYTFAEREYKRSIQIVQRALGPDHYKVAIYTNNLADVYRKMTKYDQAKILYQKALVLIEKAFGNTHSEYAEVLYGQGLNNLCLQDFPNAIRLIQTAIDIVKKELGDNHAKVGIYMNSLAETLIAKLNSQANSTNTHEILDELDQIRLMYDQSYDILLKDLGPHHPEIADILTNRAEFEFKWGSHQLSKEYFEKALEIIKIAFDEEHIKYKTISDRIRYF